MKRKEIGFLIALIPSLMVLVAISYAGEQITPPAKIAPLIPAKIAAVAGQPVLIDASAAKGEVKWNFDFDAKFVLKDGKKLFFASAVNGVYKVQLISWDDKRDEVCEITVGDPLTPPIDPTAADSLKLLRADMNTALAKIDASISKIDAKLVAFDARISAIEKKPPVPTPNKIATALTFVVLAPTQATANVTEDVGFRAYLKEKGISIYALRTQAEIEANPRFKAAVLVLQAPPAIFLQEANGDILDYVPITTLDAAKALVSKHVK